MDEYLLIRGPECHPTLHAITLFDLAAPGSTERANRKGFASTVSVTLPPTASISSVKMVLISSCRQPVAETSWHPSKSFGGLIRLDQARQSPGLLLRQSIAMPPFADQGKKPSGRSFPAG